MNSVIHLVYATDEGYLIPSLVSALSAVHHCSNLDDLAIHIVDCGIREKVDRRVQLCVSRDEEFAHAQVGVGIRRHASPLPLPRMYESRPHAAGGN